IKKMFYDNEGFYNEIEEEMNVGIKYSTWEKLSDKIASYPDDPELLFLAGKYNFHSDDLSKAQAYFYRVLDKGTCLAEKNAYYGWALLKLNDTQNVEKYINKALKYDANDATV